MIHGYKLGQKITDDNDDRNRGQRSTEFRRGNRCVATIFSQLYRMSVILML